MPTEAWVRKMMDYAQLDGLIDPKSFVCSTIAVSTRQTNTRSE